MEALESNVVTPFEFYDMIYRGKKPSQLEWVAGTASPQLLKLVSDGVLQSGMRVLDLGCGVGSSSVFLAVRGMKVTALDLSYEAVALGQQLAKVYGVNVNFNQGNALDMPYADEQFDVICDNGVFHHLYDQLREYYADSVARVLHSGGKFILRCFSDCSFTPSGMQPRRIAWQELADTFSSQFNLEHLERVPLFFSKQQDKPLVWHSVWTKK